MISRNTCYMADFSSSDRRSAKAHLAGKSLRANAYIAFAFAAGLLGRAESAPEDFVTVCRFFFARRERLLAARATAGRIVTAIVGLVAGGLLYCLMER